MSLKLISIFLLFCLYLSAVRADDLTEEQKKYLNSYLAKKGSAFNIPRNSVKAQAVGNDLFAVIYTDENSPGNYYSQVLTIFSRKKSGNYTALISAVVGGKNNRAITDIVDIVNNHKEGVFINVKQRLYKEQDSSCCPSICGRTTFVFHKNTLIETHPKIFIKQCDE